jgi:hypothetical protein
MFSLPIIEVKDFESEKKVEENKEDEAAIKENETVEESVPPLEVTKNC